MNQRIIDLYDEFTHGGMDRRDFLTRLSQMTGGMAAAVALLPRLENNYEGSGLVPVSDPDLQADYLSYPGASGQVRAYRARPSGSGPFPAVVVIHENRGLNPHIEDVARRAALAGYWALAPDALSPLGGTPESTDEARSRLGQLDRETTVGDFVAAVAFAKQHEETTDRVGCVGFCWGGGMANQLAVRSPDMKAAVAFYGRQPDAAEVPKIKGAVLLHYAGLDSRINAGIPAYEAALKASSIPYELHTYEGVNHAFHNDTAPTRYNQAAAKLAWERTLDFFSRYLKG